MKVYVVEFRLHGEWMPTFSEVHTARSEAWGARRQMENSGKWVTPLRVKPYLRVEPAPRKKKARKQRSDVQYPDSRVWAALLGAPSINAAAKELGMSTGALRKRCIATQDRAIKIAYRDTLKHSKGKPRSGKGKRRG